ncbi:hypothetical protein [Chitinophaga sp. Ak27]|uniref:hypothetical protein n=1 Tax=Chitinophaga sp. Ak27 TaxID=2726116 RepID=UPI00145E0F9C|nr:hypothetical protein [Chitinophaga sp. Ak27]
MEPWLRMHYCLLPVSVVVIFLERGNPPRIPCGGFSLSDFSTTVHHCTAGSECARIPENNNTEVCIYQVRQLFKKIVAFVLQENMVRKKPAMDYGGTKRK